MLGPAQKTSLVHLCILQSLCLPLTTLFADQDLPGPGILWLLALLLLLRSVMTRSNGNQYDCDLTKLSEQHSVILQQEKDITHLQHHVQELETDVRDQGFQITTLKDKVAELKASMAQKKKEAEHWCCRFGLQNCALQRSCISLADFAAKLPQAIDVDLPAANGAMENALSQLHELEITSEKNYNILTAIRKKVTWSLGHLGSLIGCDIHPQVSSMSHSILSCPGARSTK